MKLEIGDIIGYKPKATDSLVSFIIKIGGKLRYSHVLMYIGNNKVIESGPKGVKISDIWLDVNDTEKVKVIRYKNPLKETQQIKLLETAYSYLDTPYAYWQYPFLFLYSWFGKYGWANKICHLIKKINDRTFVHCSEYVARVYQEALGMQIADEEHFDFVLPDDIMDNPNFVEVEK